MKRLRPIPRAVLIVDAILIAASFVIGVLGGQFNAFALVFQLLFTLIVFGLSIIGALIITRQPDNRVGSIFLAASVGVAVSTASFNYISLSQQRFDLTLPGTVLIAWVSSWVMIPTLISMVIFVPMLFPTGHVPSPRWRPLAIFGIVGICVTSVGSAVVAGPLDTVGVNNPVGIIVPHPLVDILGAGDAISGILLFFLTAVSVVVRYRHGTPLERLQLRWFAFPAVVGIVLLGVSTIVETAPIGDAAWMGMLVCLALLPLAIGVAILRHRLFDIDLVIKRTIGYGVLTVLVIGLEVVGILVIQELLTTVVEGQSQTLAIVLSTLAVASIFQPARRRIQTWVDRRFDRSRYDAAQVVAGFSVRLRDSLNLEAVRRELAATATTALHPSSADVWLRNDRRA